MKTLLLSSLRNRLIAMVGLAFVAYTLALVLTIGLFEPATADLTRLDLATARARLQLAARDWQAGTLEDFLRTHAEPLERVEALDGEGRRIWGQPLARTFRKSQILTSSLQLGNVSLVLRAQSPPGLVLLPTPQGLLTAGLRVALLALIGVFFGRALLEQIRQALSIYSEALGRIGAGYRLPETADPDLAPVSADFNQMAAQLEATEQSLVESARRLEAVEAHKARVLAMVSHELRTPLTAVLGYAGPQSGELQGCGQNLLRRLDRLLEWARLDAGQLRLHLEDFELDEVLEDALSEWDGELQRWPESTFVHSDFRWLSRALRGLAGLGASQLAVTAVEPAVELLALGPFNFEQAGIGQHLSLAECRQVIEALGGQLDGSAEVLRVRLAPPREPAESSASPS